MSTKNKELPFQIVQMDSFRVVGYMTHTTNKGGAGKKALPQFWSKCKQEGLDHNLMPLGNKEPYGLFGINIYNTDSADPRKFAYLIAVSSDAGTGEGLEAYTVPSMTWAVFPCTLETIGKTEAMAITKWLPKSDYRPLNKGYITGKMKSGAPDIEYYGKDGRVEVWVAVKEK